MMLSWGKAVKINSAPFVLPPSKARPAPTPTVVDAPTVPQVSAGTGPGTGSTDSGTNYTVSTAENQSTISSISVAGGAATNASMGGGIGVSVGASVVAGEIREGWIGRYLPVTPISVGNARLDIIQCYTMLRYAILYCSLLL